MDKKTFYTKLLKSQMEIGAIKKSSDNPFFHSKYADINDMLAVVKPVLNKHGLVLTQGLEMCDGKMGIRTSITDAETQEHYSPFVELPVMADPQKQGSAITYFRRYSVQSLLALEAEDDDGNSASGTVEPKGKHAKLVESFMQDLEPTDDEVAVWREKIQAPHTLLTLKALWKTVPIHIQDKLVDLKDQRKFEIT